ncbi:MAG TPA: serine/threonine protein kinase, partial [Desulfobacterales bacterium]|nr:serine/threonine protein kinase [Desulfobacterales bacterium]
MIGQEIGNYKIIDIIGKGGMAVVYLGQHKALTRRTVAIKMLSASLEGDSAFNERFFREAEVMDRLDHPNVVTLYDFIEHEGRYFIVMEYISGKTLAHLIQERGGPLPLEEVSVIFKQVFDAIAYAHDLGIVHRDLKP